MNIFIKHSLKDSFTHFMHYLSMIKFSHTLFALPLAAIVFVQVLQLDVMNQAHSIPFILFLILVCMVSLRSAAMGFNRIVDAKYDAENTRTEARHIPLGKIGIKASIFFVTFFSLVFLLATYFISFKIFLLAFVVLFLTFTYSYTKRFTYLCHFFLGFVIGMSPSAVYLVLTGSLPVIPIVWTCMMTFHIAGFDILYSMQDYEYDKSKNLHSVPVRFGIKKALLIAGLSHALSYVSLLVVCFLLGREISVFFFSISVMLAGILFFLEHLIIFIERKKYLPFAFFHINVSISIVLFLGVLLDFLI